MKLVVQRVLSASCTIDGVVTGQIGAGYCVFAGFCASDTKETVDKMVRKLLNLRICSDSEGLMNLSILQTKGSILSVSQFTLYANARKGNRPSFIDAARPKQAIPLYDYFNESLAKEVPVATGVFGADMKIALVNDGPVTILLNSEELFG